MQDTLQFLMTREIAHLQMFDAALESIQPNFPPGILQGDPRYTHAYFNMSEGATVRGPWNQGQGPWPKGEWTYIEDPVQQVRNTEGLVDQQNTGPESRDELERKNRQLAKMRSNEVSQSMPSGKMQWSTYKETAPRKKAS